MRVTPNCDSINSFLISDAANIQMFPDVAYGGGIYLVVWSDSRLGTSQNNIFAARVTTAGAVLDPGGLGIGPMDAQYHYCPSVGYNGTSFVTVWGTYNTPGALYSATVSASGAVSDTIRLATGSYIYGTAIARSPSNFMVVWAEYVSSVFALKGLIVSNSGTPVGSPFTVFNNIEYYNGVNLCWDGTNYFVVYADATPSGTHQIWGRKYTTAGAPVGGAIPVSNGFYFGYYPNVCAGTNNRYLNVWDENRGMYNKAYGNVDVPIIGIQETDGSAPNRKTGATIIRGELLLPLTGTWKVYDITGREVRPTGLAPGVYYLEHDGMIERKVVKIQ